MTKHNWIAIFIHVVSKRKLLLIPHYRNLKYIFNVSILEMY